jgi:Concanavalin A-like lectin/glucanases superfamily
LRALRLRGHGRRSVPFLVSFIVAAVIGLLAMGPSASALSPGGTWLFSQGSGQTVLDMSGNHNNATLGSTPLPDVNDPTWIPRAFLGMPALHFGGSQFLTVPDAPSLDSAQVTLAAIVRAPSSPGAYSYIASKGAFRCSAASYGLYTGATGGLSFYVSNGAYSYTLSPDAGTSVWDGKWHMVVGTFDGSTVRLYVDGVQVGTGTPSTITIQYGLPDGNQFSIGDYLGPCPTSLGFVGDMAAVAVLQGVMTQPFH